MLAPTIHLRLKDPDLPINYTLKEYDEPAQRYCPGVMKFKRKIRCHLKIVFIVKLVILKNITEYYLGMPEGGGGPKYGNM